MTEMIHQLRQSLEIQANPEAALAMSKYMKNQFPFFGIKSTQLAEIIQSFLRAHGLPHPDILPKIVINCWSQPEREFQYIGTGFLRRGIRSSQPDLIQTMEELIISKSWWDTVDSIATNSVGPFFQKFPIVRDEYLPVWRNSTNLWLRRTAILFQLNYKKATNFELLTSIVKENLGSKEFFINKAIGWSLREYSKTNPIDVLEFCDKTPLHNLSRREALKWINAHPA